MPLQGPSPGGSLVFDEEVCGLWPGSLQKHEEQEVKLNFELERGAQQVVRRAAFEVVEAQGLKTKTDRFADHQLIYPSQHLTAEQAIPGLDGLVGGYDREVGFLGRRAQAQEAVGRWDGDYQSQEKSLGPRGCVEGDLMQPGTLAEQSQELSPVEIERDHPPGWVDSQAEF